MGRSGTLKNGLLQDLECPIILARNQARKEDVPMRLSKADRRLLELIPEVKALTGKDDREIARWLQLRVERRANPGILAFVPGSGAVAFPEARKRVPRESHRKGRG